MRFSKFHFALLLAIWVGGLWACRNTPADTAAPAVASHKTSSLDAWADAPRQRIEKWVAEVTQAGSPNFIPEADRIAVFDNDGTLWPEQPAPTQLVFALEWLRAQAPQHPEWSKDPLLKAALDGDWKKLGDNHGAGLKKVMAVTHSGMSETAFNTAVSHWIDTAVDERFNHLYKEVLYQPMLELLDYLRAHGFQTFIVSGGGADFMRVWSEEAYGIPPYQVVGTYAGATYEVVGGKPVITKTAGEVFFDDKAAKPVAIHRFIGKVPVLCGGNSDGDQAMMQYTSGSPYKSLCVLLHHTDAEREYAYDLKTLSGHLESALAEAKEKNWLVVDMKNDFKRMFPF